MLHLIIFATLFQKQNYYRMKKISLALASLLVLGVSACKKNDDNTPKDTTKPVITLNSPSDDDEFISGKVISVQGKITDDTELSQYKIEMHNAFDGHTHKKTGATAFTWDTIVNISGKEAVLNFEITLPVDIAAGPYHFIVNALDKAGNEADFAEAELVLKNAEDLVAPTLNITTNPAPDANNIITVDANTNEITLTGTANDDKGLKSYEIKLINENDNTNYADIDGQLSGLTGNINEKITFNNQWPKGDYHLIIEAFDLKNNDVDVEFEVVWK